MRGKPEDEAEDEKKERITPAGAGKTSVMRLNQKLYEDHPRRCGENSSSSSNIILLIGSPPQVRGKPVEIVDDKTGEGITPAGAGKTKS